MSVLSKRATVYLDPSLHRALRLKAVETSRSVSALLNEAVQRSLAEDREDLAAFAERAHEPRVSFEDALKDLGRIPRKDVTRILAAIRALAENPRPSQSLKLSGQEKYRLRQGDYRVLYSIQDRERSVWIVKVAQRGEAYR